MNAIDKKIENITNSAWSKLVITKDKTIYQFNENPKFAYFVYTGEVNIISKNGYNLGKVNEGELFGEIATCLTKNIQFLPSCNRV